MLEFKQYVMSKLNEATEENDFDKLGFVDEDSANVFYYIGRLITNKGPQTEGAIEKYLESKFGNNHIPGIDIKNKTLVSWSTFLSRFFYKEGRKWDFTAACKEWWQEVANWHDTQAREADPYAAIVSVFWDWYREKKKGNNVEPDAELLKFINNATDETLEKTFGKYYKFAMGLLEPYKNGGSNLTEEDKLIQKFWDWHRAKKAGKPYELDQDTIDGLVTFLRRPKAVEVLQQYYYYFVRVIEKMSDKNIKTPINTDGLQKELQRIMDNLDNDNYVDELEKIERNRLRGGDMTAGPVFVLPVDVIKTIRTLAKDDDNIVQSKVGKIDKEQVKECYTYCNNELNRKFHIGKTGIFDLNIQDFYDTYKIVFKRGFNTKTLHKIFDEVCQYLLDQLDKGTAEYWKNRGKIEIDDVEDFNEAYKALKSAGYTILKEDKYMDDMENELDNIDTVNKFNEFFRNVASTVEDKFEVKLKPAKVPYFKFGNELEGNKKFVSAEIDENQYIFVVGFYNDEGRKTTAFGKEIDNPWFKHIEVCVGGYVHKKDKDILVGATGIEKDLSNLEEAIDFYKANLPKTANGFFKRLFKNESVEDDAEEGILSVWDREKILKGQTPSWAKSVTELKPKAKKVKGSSSWSEKAMRSVVGEREPQTESDWRLNNELNYNANKKLADIIKSKIDGDYQITKDCITLFADNGLRFEIYPGGWVYKVKKINQDKLSDREIFEDEKLDKCIEWITERI